jgi:hypothetical protein
MARPAIRAQLAVALRTALQDKSSVELRALRLDDDTTAAVDITVQAVVQPRALAGMAMIVFRDVPAAAQPARAPKQAAGQGRRGGPGIGRRTAALARGDHRVAPGDACLAGRAAGGQ